MIKAKLHIDEPQPRQIQRADVPPSSGYAIIVDGHFKTQFDDEKGARDAATQLRAKYPMLKIELYDAAAKSRMQLN